MSARSVVEDREAKLSGLSFSRGFGGAAPIVLVAMLGVRAPIQCTHDPDPSVRTEDTAGDALWDLAEDFEAHGDHAASHHTLETLVTRYPSSRHTLAAKDVLDGGAWSPTLDNDASR